MGTRAMNAEVTPQFWSDGEDSHCFTTTYHYDALTGA
jgi:hypothetical protein